MKLPKFIENKKAVVNIKNNDVYCFAWAIVSALYPAVNNVSEVSSYPKFEDVLNVDGIEFPMKLKTISKFEDLNDISVNVYGLERIYEDGKIKYEIVGPVRHKPPQSRLRRHINLLLITDECGNSHYCWIKNLSRLVSSQISNTQHRKFFCDGCLLYFSSENVLLRHQFRDCNNVYTTTPSTCLKKDKRGNYVPDNVLKFQNYERQLKVPFVVYADFESILKPIATCMPEKTCPYTVETYAHEPYSFAYLIKCSFDDSLTKFVTYSGDNAGKEFVRSLEEDLQIIYHKYLKVPIPMSPLSVEELTNFYVAEACNICEEKFLESDVKVRDHCHLTGKKRPGAAHSNCNLNFKLPKYIPVYFHNLSGYDAHLFIKNLYDAGDSTEVLAENKEKYISFTKSLYTHSYVGKDGKLKKNYLKIRFLDSFRFLASSLDKLSAKLPTQYCVELRKHFGDGKKFDLMRKKGVFPYSFMDSVEKLKYENLPNRCEFYDKLKERNVTDEEYERAKEVWRVFECKKFGDYSDLYLKSDVLILCDVFEHFRGISLKQYKLDPAHYYTSPGLSWDAMLRFTKVELELLTDIDMVNFFKKGIRGGISQCVERKHIANNPNLPHYNPFVLESSIHYLDATNLYGFGMSQALPTGGFKWLSDEEVSNFKVEKVGDEDKYGYVLEVDMLYPYYLHDEHMDLPFLVESKIPPSTKSKIPKLIPNLSNKENYIIHYRNLKQAVANGLILTRIHRILKFRQSKWLKKYIDLNTEMRNKATDKCEKDHYKRMVNSVYGKTMENVDVRRDIKLKTHWRCKGSSSGANVLMAKPNFKSCSIFAENFVAIHMGRTKVCYNKPMYIGFAVLELSKVRMYDFYYGLLKKKLRDKVSLLYMDTDSFILKVKQLNFYNFMKDNIEHFDTSNYKPSNVMNLPITESKLGNFKDEFANDYISVFLGTGAKAYYVKSVDNEAKKAKGVKSYVIDDHLDKNDYEKVVDNVDDQIYRTMNGFRSKLHDVYTEMKNKVALSYQDEKRFIIPNTTKTLPWGHKDIRIYGKGYLSMQEFRKCVDEIDNNCDQGQKLDLLLKLLKEELK